MLTEKYKILFFFGCPISCTHEQLQLARLYEVIANNTVETHSNHKIIKLVKKTKDNAVYRFINSIIP